VGDAVDQLRDAGVGRGDLVGLAVAGDRAALASSTVTPTS